MNAQQIAWLPEEVRNHIAQLEHDLARLTAENEIETQELAAALRQMLLVIGKHNIEAPGLVRAQEALARAESATCQKATNPSQISSESATPGLRTDNPMAEPVMGGLPRYDGEKLGTPANQQPAP